MKFFLLPFPDILDGTMNLPNVAMAGKIKPGLLSRKERPGVAGEGALPLCIADGVIDRHRVEEVDESDDGERVVQASKLHRVDKPTQRPEGGDDVVVFFTDVRDTVGCETLC